MNGIIDRGHNNPPELLPVLPPEDIVDVEGLEAARIAHEGVTTYDAEKMAILTVKVGAFANACGAWKDLGLISSAHQSERLTDFITGARNLFRIVDDQRKAEKKRWDDAAKEVQDAFAPLLKMLERCAGDLKPMQEDWLKRESKRIADEKAEQARAAREAAEAAAKAAAEAEARNDVAGAVMAEQAAKEAEKALKAAERTTKAKAGSATGAGRTMALRKVRTAKINSQNSVYMHFRDRPEVLDLLQRLANAAVRAGEAVPGCEVVETEVAA